MIRMARSHHSLEFAAILECERRPHAAACSWQSVHPLGANSPSRQPAAVKDGRQRRGICRFWSQIRSLQPAKEGPIESASFANGKGP